MRTLFSSLKTNGKNLMKIKEQSENNIINTIIIAKIDDFCIFNLSLTCLLAEAIAL